MLLVMHNLPAHIKYSDIKILIRNKCGIDDIILDKLVKDGISTKKVTIGVAKEDDSMSIMQRLNGTFVEGLQVYIEEVNKGNGQFGPSGSKAQTGSSHNFVSNIGNARSQNRGYDSYNVQKENDSQRYAVNDRGLGSQNYQEVSRQDTRDYGSRNASSKFNLDEQTERYENRDEPRRLDFQKTWGNSWGFSQGNDRSHDGDRKRRHSPERSWQDRDRFQPEFGSQGRGFDSDSREKEFGGNQARGFDSDSRDKGLGSNQGTDFDSDPRGKGFGTNHGRGFENDSRTGFGDRQGRDFDTTVNHSTSFQCDSRNSGFGDREFEGEVLGGNQGRGFERNRNTRFGNNQGKFEDDSRGNGFGNNQNRGFGNNPWGNASDGKQERGLGGRENFNRGGRSRETTPPKPIPKPYQPLANLNPYSWSNTFNPTKTVKPFDNKPSPAEPFDNKPSFSNTKPLNNQEPRPIHSPGPPLSQGSPVKLVIPNKRPKIEEFPKCDVAPTDKKTQNKVLTWRAMGVSIIAKMILVRFLSDDYQHGKKAFKQTVLNTKALKKALNNQLLEIIKRKYPKNPYPFLHEHQIVALYRQTHPESEDFKMFKDHFPLIDLLPPWVRQNNPRQLSPKPAKKPKPVNLEKRAKYERAILHKREFLDESLYKCKTPAMEKALNDVLDEITNVYNNAVDGYETTDKDEKVVGQGIISKTSAEFRWTVRLHTIKRILNETSTLIMRIFINGGEAPKTEVERVLQPYGVMYLKASKMSTQILTACVDSFENFDTLCLHTGVACNGRDGTTSYVTAKPLHLTIPMKFRQLLRQKQLHEQDDDEMDFSDDVELPADDDVEQPDDEDDDVIEVVKETDVIELSGDENMYNVPDEIQHDVKCAISDKIDATSGSATKNTVDLTHEDDDFADDVNVTVDDKISAEMGDVVVEIDEEGIREDDLEDY